MLTKKNFVIFKMERAKLTIEDGRVIVGSLQTITKLHAIFGGTITPILGDAKDHAPKDTVTDDQSKKRRGLR